MTFEEYSRHDAIGLARLIASRQVSELEVLEAALARMDVVNPTLNAVIARLESEARKAIEVGLPDGPLRGVPFLVKDLGMLVKGAPTRAGSRLFSDAAPAMQDSALIAAYRRAGLVLIGKTNTPEFGMAATTEPVSQGPTLNPWRLDRTCGGSSGGSAAAVAAGIAPAAHASDGGGSIRIPASCCGLFGLKPSRGRVSNSPLGDTWGGFAVNHAVTRSVRDSAVLLDVSCRPVAGDSYWIEPPSTSFLAEAGADPGALRIGLVEGALMASNVAPEVAQAAREAARKCEALGHHVAQAAIDADFAAMREAANTIVAASVANMFRLEGKRRGRPVRQNEIESVPWICLQQGEAASAVDVMNAFLFIYDFTQRVARCFESSDVLLMATLGKPPVRVGELSIAEVDPATYPDALYDFMPNTQPFNVSGAPAMSVPMAWSEDGLPIGIQFVARTGAEATLLRLAGQLETAHPWADRRPPDPPLSRL
ncbi:MAG: amidase [Caulobacteraceae bacterium]